MPKLIYQGDELAAAVLEGEEIGTVVGALRYVIGHMHRDPAVGELLAHLTAPPPSDQPKGDTR